MTELPKRVRVVLGDVARPAPPVEPRQEIADQTGLGEVLVRGLIRAQLALAVRLALVVAVGLGAWPLLFAVVPGLAGASAFGMKLPWLLLGVLAYPFLLLVGWLYLRSAERNERVFAELVDRS